jgi:hypothetical protein
MHFEMRPLQWQRRLLRQARWAPGSGQNRGAGADGVPVKGTSTHKGASWKIYPVVLNRNSLTISKCLTELKSPKFRDWRRIYYGKRIAINRSACLRSWPSRTSPAISLPLVGLRTPSHWRSCSGARTTSGHGSLPFNPIYHAAQISDRP